MCVCKSEWVKSACVCEWGKVCVVAVGVWVCGWFCKRIVNCDLKTFIVQATGLVNLARANKNSQIKVI